MCKREELRRKLTWASVTQEGFLVVGVPQPNQRRNRLWTDRREGSIWAGDEAQGRGWKGETHTVLEVAVWWSEATADASGA